MHGGHRWPPDYKTLRARLCVQMDFAENYSIFYHDEIQGAHWHKNQITIMIWLKQQAVPWAILSDTTSHDKYIVAAFFTDILTYIQLNFPEAVQVKVWTDGPSNKYIFAFLVHLKRRNLNIFWNYLATSHGKGPCDGLCGTIKRLVHKY